MRLVQSQLLETVKLTMTSFITTYSNSQDSECTISTSIAQDLPPNTYSRTVSDGKPVHGSFRVQSYKTQPLHNRSIPVQLVTSYEEYLSGCGQHSEKCLGHYCITPRGTILLPQRMATSLGIMSNDYAKAAEMVFNRDSPSQETAYRDKLYRLMLRKDGRMRGNMVAGPVDSSAREVIASCWLNSQEFAVPKMVAQNMKVLRVGKDKSTGLPMGHYMEDSLKEGDTVIIVRPPSLWARNVQPAKVVLWNHECFGPSASSIDEFHADHDGDEMQMYFIALDSSIEQCNNWIDLKTCTHLESVMNNPLPESIVQPLSSKDCSKTLDSEKYQELRKKYMVHSTLSVRELLEGKKLPSISKSARMKEPMVNMFVERLKNQKRVYKDFSPESDRGRRDVMAQQLNQGALGDMSRQARLAASCIKYQGNGVFHIKACTETIKSISVPLQRLDTGSSYPLGGNACVRAITALCKIAQQAALDSHRVSQDVSSKLNLINNLIVGGTESFIALESNTVPPSSWTYYSGKVTYCVVNNEIAKGWAQKLVAAYNPILLKAVKLVNGDVKEVCRKGIVLVCNYYGIKLTDLEMYSITELFCYRCDACSEPITNKVGMLKRDMRWISTIFANHYGKIKVIQQKGKTSRFVQPETITDCIALCNFDYS